MVVGALEATRRHVSNPVKVLVTGAGGQLGQELVRAFVGHEVFAMTSAHLDVTDRDAVMGFVTSARPDVVVHAAAWTAVDACEADPDRALRVNALGSRHVAEACARASAYLCAVSTDYVFDGVTTVAYTEWDPTNPKSVYGRSKLAGEREVRGLAPGSAVVRTSWLCGAGGPNFAKTMLGLAKSGGGEVKVVADQWGCPTFTADLAEAIRQLAATRMAGLFHVTNQGATTWHGFATAIFEAAGSDATRVVPIATGDLDPPRAAPRPAFSVLDNAALRLSGSPLLPDYHEPLERLVKELST
ncbi:MAG: dTDP-4-dehydrorhamnose reductase [Acidimicrobiales bacterium]